MRIIRTIESFYPYVSGPAKQAFEISKRLISQGIESPIFTSDFEAGDSPDSEDMEGVKVLRFKKRYGIYKYLVTPSIKTEIKRSDFDIIHGHNYRNYQADIGYKLAKKHNKPFILNSHGALLGYKNFVSGMGKLPYFFYDLFTRRKTVLDADKIIVSSDLEVSEAQRFGVRRDRIAKIPMGINIKDYITERKANEKITLLFVGRISRNRNLEPLIYAMKNVDEKYRLRIVGSEEKSSGTQGSGYLNELMALVKNLGLTNIDFIGPRYGKELITEYKKADIFIYPSLSENFGQTMLEAAASGLPIIATPVGIARELIKSNYSGYIVDYSDPEKFSVCIDMLSGFNDRVRFGKRLQKKVIENFSWEKIMMDYEKVYLEALESKNINK